MYQYVQVYTQSYRDIYLFPRRNNTTSAVEAIVFTTYPRFFFFFTVMKNPFLQIIKFSFKHSFEFLF